MNHTRNSSQIRGVKNIKTVSSLFLTEKEREHLDTVIDKRVLAKEEIRERLKFARQDAAIKRFRKNYYKAREKLAATINKNRHLMKIRFSLQRNRQREDDCNKIKTVGNFRKVELKY
ncbi:MAG TPA: hypothetical protein DHV84_06195 [Desulfotomaculum sp.]|jgi:hypothetical protein|nr:hypothetical protein [Desulfotomaculum sp.]